MAYFVSLCLCFTLVKYMYFLDWCLQDEVGPIFPANTSDRIPPPETLTKFYLDKVLDCMSTQVCIIYY